MKSATEAGSLFQTFITHSAKDKTRDPNRATIKVFVSFITMLNTLSIYIVFGPRRFFSFACFAFSYERVTPSGCCLHYIKKTAPPPSANASAVTTERPDNEGAVGKDFSVGSQVVVLVGG